MEPLIIKAYIPGKGHITSKKITDFFQLSLVINDLNAINCKHAYIRYGKQQIKLTPQKIKRFVEVLDKCLTEIIKQK